MHTRTARHAHVAQVRLAAASEQLSRLFEHTYVFQCYQPTYSSGHYAFMFASRTRRGRAEAAQPRGHPPTRPPTVPQAHPLAQGGPSLGPRAVALAAALSPQTLRRRSGARPKPPMPPRSAVSVAPSKDHTYYGRLHPFKAKVDWARYTLPTTYT